MGSRGAPQALKEKEWASMDMLAAARLLNTLTAERMEKSIRDLMKLTTTTKIELSDRLSSEGFPKNSIKPYNHSVERTILAVIKKLSFGVMSDEDARNVLTIGAFLVVILSLMSVFFISSGDTPKADPVVHKEGTLVAPKRY
jgi:hypothetical protein